MTDYISREDALIVVCEGCNIDFDKEPCEPSDCTIRGFIRSIPAADVRPVKWIPVTERLPDTMKDKSVYSGWSAEIAPSDDVLCYLGSEKRQTVAWYSHIYSEWTTVDENTVYKYGEITHWMPLPEPPKEET